MRLYTCQSNRVAQDSEPVSPRVCASTAYLAGDKSCLGRWCFPVTPNLLGIPPAGCSLKPTSAAHRRWESPGCPGHPRDPTTHWCGCDRHREPPAPPAPPKPPAHPGRFAASGALGSLAHSPCSSRVASLSERSSRGSAIAAQDPSQLPRGAGATMPQPPALRLPPSCSFEVSARWLFLRRGDTKPACKHQ